MELQPIETAPKNGTYILLFGKSGYSTTPLRCSVCRWSRDKDRWDDYAGDAFSDSGDPPIHWCPLPSEQPEAGDSPTCKDCVHYDLFPPPNISCLGWSLHDGWCRDCNEATSAHDTCDWHEKRCGGEKQ